jgi:hypothetical protein
MNAIDSYLTNQLRDTVDDIGDSTPPTQLLLLRGRRARHRRAVQLTGVSMAVLAAATAASLIATGGTAAHSDRSTHAASVSPRMRLAAVLTNSENISYKVNLTTSFKSAGGQPWGAHGAFDPATNTGQLYAPFQDGTGYYEERLINGVRYDGATGATFKREPGTFTYLNYEQTLGGVLTATADPQQLFRTLQEANATVTQTGAGTYRFTADINTDPASGLLTDKLMGDITVNADHRVASVSYQRTSQVTKNGKVETMTYHVLVELSDYGLPVTVQPPAQFVISH